MVKNCEFYHFVLICVFNILAIVKANSQSDLPWERSASAPCGVYNNDGLRTPWQPCNANTHKPDASANSESKFNIPCLGNEEIKKEIIDDGEVSYNNKLSTLEPNNISSKNYTSFCNESMSETNTTKLATSPERSKTNGRKLISQSQGVSRDEYRSTRHESKCKVSKSLLYLN